MMHIDTRSSKNSAATSPAAGRNARLKVMGGIESDFEFKFFGSQDNSPWPWIEL
jgi:hypothetical protein